MSVRYTRGSFDGGSAYFVLLSLITACGNTPGL